jgi:hypothetical protein
LINDDSVFCGVVEDDYCTDRVTGHNSVVSEVDTNRDGCRPARSGVPASANQNRVTLAAANPCNVLPIAHSMALLLPEGFARCALRPGVLGCFFELPATRTPAHPSAFRDDRHTPIPLHQASPPGENGRPVQLISSWHCGLEDQVVQKRRNGLSPRSVDDAAA